MLAPHQITRQAAWTAHGLADAARRRGDHDGARYFNRQAAAALARADRLFMLALRHRRFRVMRSSSDH